MPSTSSPCIQVCVIEPETSLCRGCGRTLGEIAAWGTMPEVERRRIMTDLPTRTTRSDATGDAA